jgi:hypothetical protein
MDLPLTTSAFNVDEWKAMVIKTGLSDPSLLEEFAPVDVQTGGIGEVELSEVLVFLDLYNYNAGPWYKLKGMLARHQAYLFQLARSRTHKWDGVVISVNPYKNGDGNTLNFQGPIPGQICMYNHFLAFSLELTRLSPDDRAQLTHPEMFFGDEADRPKSTKTRRAGPRKRKFAPNSSASGPPPPPPPPPVAPPPPGSPSIGDYHPDSDRESSDHDSVPELNSATEDEDSSETDSGSEHATCSMIGPNPPPPLPGPSPPPVAPPPPGSPDVPGSPSSASTSAPCTPVPIPRRGRSGGDGPGPSHKHRSEKARQRRASRRQTFERARSPASGADTSTPTNSASGGGITGQAEPAWSTGPNTGLRTSHRIRTATPKRAEALHRTQSAIHQRTEEKGEPSSIRRAASVGAIPVQFGPRDSPSPLSPVPRRSPPAIDAHSSPAESEDDLEEGSFEVHSILDVRVKSRSFSYLVRWVGCGSESDSWEPAMNLANTANTAIDSFYTHHPDAAMAPSVNRRRKAAREATERIQLALATEARGPIVQASAPPPNVLPWVPAQREGRSDVVFIRQAPIVDRPTANPISERECWDTLLNTITTLHLHSRPLLGLSPFSRMSGPLKAMWGAAMDNERDALRLAIDHWETSGDDLAILQAVLSLIELPARELSPIMNCKKPHGVFTLTFDDGTPDAIIDLGPAPEVPDEEERTWSPNWKNLPVLASEAGVMQDGTRKEVRSAVSLMHKDRQKQATKVLIGNGVANRDSEADAVMTSMHTVRKEPLELPEIVGPQLRVHVQDCFDRLKAEASMKDSPTGVFGLSAGMHLNQRGRKNKEDTLMWQIARLQVHLVAADLPDSIYFLLTAGGLTALHKEDQAQQAERKARGDPPKLRPINSGSTLLKGALRCAAAHPSATLAKAPLRPIQRGNGVSAGAEGVVHLTRLMYEAGHPVGTSDGKNAFGNMLKKKMLRSAASAWSESTALYRKTYGRDGVVLFRYVGDDEKACIGVKRSAEGARMGCVLGTDSYNFAAHEGLYAPLAAEFPEYILRALTDDLTPILPKGSTPEEWRIIYERYTQYLLRWDVLGAEYGLQRHQGKDVLLLPPGAPWPAAGSRIYDLTTVTREGVKIAGAFIGPPEKVAAFALEKVRSLQHRLDTVIELAGVNPQAAIRVATNALNCGLDYFVRTTPPEYLIEAIMLFDTSIQEAVIMCTLRADKTQPTIAANRIQRTCDLMSLPLDAGGLGLTPLALKAPAAFLAATLTAMREDPEIEKLREQAAAATSGSYKILLATLNESDLKPFPTITKVLPPSAAALALVPLTDSTRPILKHSALRKVQGVIVSTVQLRKLENFRDLWGPGGIPLGVGTSQHDRNHVALVSMRSQSSRAFQATLWYPRNRMTPDDFAYAIRYHLNLPQLIRGGDTLGADVALVGEEAGWAVCAVDHGSPNALSPTGSHCTWCKTGGAARYRLHTTMNCVCDDFAREAGGITTREPPTHGLLMGKYGAGQCRLMFPKVNSIESKGRQEVMRRMADMQAGMQEGPAKVKHIQNMAAFAAATPGKWKGLRIDLRVLFPDCEVWVDVGSVHPTSNSTSRAVTIWAEKLAVAERAARGGRARNSMLKVPSPAVKVACVTKHNRYAPLVAIAANQHKKGVRPFAPRFVAAIISHTGEFAPELITMIELFTKQFAKHSRTLNLEDGVREARRTSDFRRRFKDALMVAVLGGFGRVLHSAGGPWDRGVDDPVLDGISGILPSMEGEL